MSEHEHDDLPPELEAAYRAERNRPPMDDAHAHRLRLAVAAKLGPPPSGGGSDSEGGGSGGEAPPAPPASGTASGLLSASHLAALVTGLATGVVVGALGHAALVTEAPSPPRPPVGEAVFAAPEPEPPAMPTEPAVEPEGDTDVSTAQDEREPTPVSSPLAGQGSRDAPATLAAERRLVDLARAALAQGRHEPALSALATHRRRFPNGSLAEERDALVVEALAAAGRREEAAAAATEFDRAHPESLYRGRVRSAVGR
jgi:hypothetical protein